MTSPNTVTIRRNLKRLIRETLRDISVAADVAERSGLTNLSDGLRHLRDRWTREVERLPKPGPKPNQRRSK